MNKKSILGFLLSSSLLVSNVLVASSSFCLVASPAIYKEVGDSYMRSFAIEKNEPSDDIPVSLSVPHLDRYEKLRILFSLFGNKNGEYSDYCLNQQMRDLLEDLEIFYGQGVNHSAHVFSNINYTQTIFGEVALAKMVAQPSSDISFLRKRQAFIKELVENEQLFQELDDLLFQLKQAESAIFSFWQEEDPVSEELFKKLYFKKFFLKRFNNNPFALEVLTRLGNLGTTLMLSWDLVLGAGLNYLCHKKQIVGLGPISFPSAVVGTLKGAGNLINPKAFYDYYKDYYNNLDTAEFNEKFDANMRQGHSYMGMDISQEKLDLLREDNKRKLPYNIALDAVLRSGYVVIRGIMIKSAISGASQVKNATNYLQQRLIGVADLINCLKQIENIADQDSVIKDGLQYFDRIGLLFEHAKAEKTNLAALTNLLQTRTFKGDPSFFSLSGRVRAAYNLMDATKENLIGVMESIGEVDACLSIAKLYKEFENQRVNYAFVNYVENDKPYIKLVDFWNPIVNPGVVVPNSLELGKDGDARNIILTGSNTGGKSTILKGVMLNILLAQTLGIAPATEATMTPFTNICTYLNIKDDTALGNSSFKAEVLRAQSIINTVGALQDGEFAFIVVDELFKGTSADKGQDAAYDVVKHLSQSDKSCFIMATHYPKLTTLSDEVATIKNCKIDVLKDDAGHLIRPFKLEDGISQNNVAQDILKEELEGIAF